MGNRRILNRPAVVAAICGALLLVALGTSVAQAQGPTVNPTPVLAVTPPAKSGDAGTQVSQPTPGPTLAANSVTTTTTTTKKASGTNPLDDMIGNMSNGVFDLKKAAYVEYKEADWNWMLIFQILVGFLAAAFGVLSLVSWVNNKGDFPADWITLLVWALITGPLLGILYKNVAKFWPDELTLDLIRRNLGFIFPITEANMAEAGPVLFCIAAIVWFHNLGQTILTIFYFFLFLATAAEKTMAYLGKRIPSVIGLGTMIWIGLFAGWAIFPKFWLSVINTVGATRETGIFASVGNTAKLVNWQFIGGSLAIVAMATVLIPLIMLAAIAWMAPKAAGAVRAGARTYRDFRRKDEHDDSRGQGTRSSRSRSDASSNDERASKEEIAGTLVVDGQGTEKKIQRPQPVAASRTKNGAPAGANRKQPASTVTAPTGTPANRKVGGVSQRVAGSPVPAASSEGSTNSMVRPDGQRLSTGSNPPSTPPSVSTPRSALELNRESRSAKVTDVAAEAGTAALVTPGPPQVKAIAAGVAVVQGVVRRFRAGSTGTSIPVASSVQRDPELLARTGGEG